MAKKQTRMTLGSLAPAPKGKPSKKLSKKGKPTRLGELGGY